MKRLHPVVLLAGLVLASACAYGGGAAIAETPTAEVAAADPGKAIFETQCVACHDVAVATLPRPAADWRPVLDRMISYGAVLSEDEIKTLEAYLVTNYSDSGH